MARAQSDRAGFENPGRGKHKTRNERDGKKNERPTSGWPAGKLDLFTGICARDLDNSRASARACSDPPPGACAARASRQYGAQKEERGQALVVSASSGAVWWPCAASWPDQACPGPLRAEASRRPLPSGSGCAMGSVSPFWHVGHCTDAAGPLPRRATGLQKVWRATTGAVTYARALVPQNGQRRSGTVPGG